jgi:DNA-directed RNA polymerase specialized sigma24 family protein
VNAETSDFTQFVKARESALRRTAWLLTGAGGLAEDLVQRSAGAVRATGCGPARQPEDSWCADMQRRRGPAGL